MCFVHLKCKISAYMESNTFSYVHHYKDLRLYNLNVQTRAHDLLIYSRLNDLLIKGDFELFCAILSEPQLQ